MRNGQISAGMDVGHGSAKLVVLARNENEEIEVLCVCHFPTGSLRNGQVIDGPSTVEAINKCINTAAEHELEIRNVFTGIADNKIEARSTNFYVNIPRLHSHNENGMVTYNEIRDVIDKAYSTGLTEGRELLHVVPISYMVDDLTDLDNPLLQVGEKLGMRAMIVSGDNKRITNFRNIIGMTGLNINELLAEAYASSLAILDNRTREIGTAILDIGMGTSDLAIFHNGSIVHTSVIDKGGQSITSAIAHQLKIPNDIAEQLKTRYGTCFTNLEPDPLVTVPGFGSLPKMDIPQSRLADIIQEEMRNILVLVKERIDEKGLWDKINAGIVLTGGGSRLDGTDILAREVFQLPVKTARPQGFVGKAEEIEHPMFSTAVGLALYGIDMVNKQNEIERKLHQFTFKKLMFLLMNWFNRLLR